MAVFAEEGSGAHGKLIDHPSSDLSTRSACLLLRLSVHLSDVYSASDTLSVSAQLAQHTWQFFSNVYKNETPLPIAPIHPSDTFGQRTAVKSWPLS
jgi:hypothetical protein